MSTRRRRQRAAAGAGGAGRLRAALRSLRRARAGRRARHLHRIRRHGVPAAGADDAGGRPVRHEIAHQWFYSLVGDDQRHTPWLDESFATWVERDLSGFGECPSPPVPVIAGVFLDSTMDVFDRRPNLYGTRRLQRRRLRARGGRRRIGHTAFRRPAEVVRRGPPQRRRAGRRFHLRPADRGSAELRRRRLGGACASPPGLRLRCDQRGLLHLSQLPGPQHRR